MRIAEIIAANLRLLAREKKIKQRYIATEMNVSTAAVNHWFKGKYPPDVDRLPDLARVMGITTAQLVTPAADWPEQETEKQMRARLEAEIRLRLAKDLVEPIGAHVTNPKPVKKN